MKKSLLFSAVALSVAVSAMADESEFRDMTPASYNFATATEIPVMVNASQYGCQVWNLSAGIWEKVGENYKDGLIVLNGNGRDNIDEIKKSMSIVDLGGTCGKVFAYCRADEEVNDVLGGLGVDAALVPWGGSSYDHLCWYSDPETPEFPNRVRVSVELNVHSNNALITGDASNGIMKAYINTDQIGQVPGDDASTAETYKVTRGEFAKRWDEEPAEGRVTEDELDDSAENDEGYYEWNPERWLLYEFDTYVPGAGEDVTYGPIFVKMELPGGANNYTIFFRNFKFYVLPENEPELDNTRARVWKYYTLGGSGAVENVAADLDSKLEVSVNGNEVTFSEGAEVYTVAGAKVATAAANQAVTLGNGIYVANANGKSVKVVVK